MAEAEAKVLLLAQLHDQARELARELAEAPFAPDTRRAVEAWLADADAAQDTWERLRTMPVERVHTLAARVLGSGEGSAA